MVSDKISNFTDEKTRFLSNFYPHKKGGGKYPHKVRVFYNNIEFDCVENAYQAAKFTDVKMQIAFSKLSPYEAKAYWETNTDYRADWHQVKLQIMEDLVRQKFSNSEELRQMLLQTDNLLLEEGNDWGDTYWGVCDRVGENNLGKILMKIREELKNGNIFSQK